MQDAIRLLHKDFLGSRCLLVTPTVWYVKHPNSSPPQSLDTQEAKETQGHLHAVKAQSLFSMLLFSKPWSRAILYSSCPSRKTFFLRKNLAQK